MQKAHAELEAMVQGTMEEFNGTLAKEIAAHQLQCNKVVRLIGDHMKKVKVRSSPRSPQRPTPLSASREPC